LSPVTFTVIGSDVSPGAKVTVEQIRHEFFFGATLPTGIFTGRNSPEDIAKFKETFTTLFNAGVIEGSFKWHEMERERGKVDYSIVDNMLAWADKEGIPLRGHCIYWGIPNRVQDWVKALSDDELRLTMQQRGRSIGARYRDRFAEYDLNNEMIHANYYAERLGPEFIKQMALWVKDGDPNAKLFVNDYDILTGNRLNDYVKDIKRLLDMGTPISGIGVQGHLHGDSFDPAALQNALDVLAQFKLPIRVTEYNFPGQRSKYYTGDRKAQMPPEEEKAKADALRQYYRLCFAHPAVTGIMMWGFWEGANWIPHEIGQRIEATDEEVLEAMRASQGHHAVSLDQTSTMGDGDEPGPLRDRIGSEDLSFDTVEYGEAIGPVLKEISDRDRMVLHLRFVEDLTQSEIAERVGVSQMHVSRILRATIEKLRQRIPEEEL
jgi:RNA polymerase sigma factor (sigma-70 family)